MNPQVMRWQGPPAMNAGAPLPSLFSTREGDLYCAYHVGDTRGQLSLAEVAVLRFQTVLHFRFGYPNDEVLNTHPLYESGLTYYEFHIVERSPLIAELEDRNRAHRSHTPGMYSARFKHFVVTFHDETLEVVAQEGILAGTSNLSPDKAVITFAQRDSGS